MPKPIPNIRVFLSSPSDVNEERKIAVDVIERLPYRPAFRERVAFTVVAWDKPGADTPMRASISPQEAINQGLPRPSECDIVVVLFWSRMGTPFTYDGQKYLSGTHWELLDALNSPETEPIIYRRIDDPPSNVNGAQYQAVQNFFESELFYASDGQILRGINTYKTPDEFRLRFESHFEELVLNLLEKLEPSKDLWLPHVQPKLDLSFRDKNGDLLNEVEFSVDFEQHQLTDEEIEEKINKRFEELRYDDGVDGEPTHYKNLPPKFNAMISARDKLLKLKYPSRDEVDNYHIALKKYLENDYRPYLSEKHAFEYFAQLTKSIEVVVDNSGTTPAKNVEVLLHFPDGFDVFEESDDPPLEPPPPRKPGPTSRLLSVLNHAVIPPPVHSMYISSDFTESVGPTISIRKTNSYEVDWKLGDLKHHYEASCVLYLLFESFDGPSTGFTVEYRITADNVPDVINGELVIKVHKVKEQSE